MADLGQGLFTGHHKFALTKKTEGKSTPMLTVSNNVLSKEDANIILYLKCSYYLAKEKMPKSKFESVLKLSESLGCDLIYDTEGKLKYSSHHSITDFQSAIAQVLVDDQIQRIKSAEFFSLTVDESTDIGNKKRLIMYVNYTSDFRVRTELLSNVQINTSSANAETITAKIVNELSEKGIDITNMIAIGTDGASVMTGKKSGVVVRLKEKSPSLLGLHCAAHRCALASSQAARSISELSKFTQNVSNIFYYFSNSALRQNKLREIQTMLNLPELKYAQVHSVRWLSLEKAVEVLYRTYPALLVSLEHEATSNTSAKGLLHEVSQYTFVSIMHMMMDILPFLSRLSKVFQTESIDFSCIEPMVSSTIDALNELKDVKGVYIDKLDDFISKQDGKVSYVRPISESAKSMINESKSLNVDGFDGFDEVDDDDDDDDDSVSSESVVNEVELKMYSVQKNVVNRLLPEYVAKITENLSDRFQSSGLVSKFNVLVPKYICVAKQSMTNQEFSNYGKKDVAQLSDHFAEHHDLVSDTVVSEYITYRGIVVGSYAGMSLSSCAMDILQKYATLLPNFSKLLKIAVLLPISSVPCERGFSTQNRILSKFRTSISNVTLNNLMHISEDGPALEDFDFARALLQWRKKLRTV